MHRLRSGRGGFHPVPTGSDAADEPNGSAEAILHESEAAMSITARLLSLMGVTTGSNEARGCKRRAFVGLLAAVGWVSVSALRAQQEGFGKRLPAKGENNIWYEKNASDTVFVFVHGIFSDSRSCWLYRSPKSSDLDQYWPEIVKNDDRLEHPSIFLGGYYTAIDAGQYGVLDAAKELRDNMLRQGVFEKPKIVFIAHSTGGIVVRYLLYHNQDLFRTKWVGLALYASPSNGSYLSNILSWLAEIYGQKLGSDLQTGSPLLYQLDQNFKDLLLRSDSDSSGVRIVGAETIENHFVVHRTWLPDKVIVVPEESGSRYFGSANRLADTDHFTIVKPASTDHVAHRFLLTYYARFKQKSFHSIPISTDLSYPHLRFEAYLDNRPSNPNHGDTATLRLRGPASVDVTNGSVVTRGVKYQHPEASSQGFPYVMGDQARGQVLLHPGTFTTSLWGASLGCLIVEEGTYRIRGDFRRANDANAGDGVDVMIVLDDDVERPLFSEHVAAGEMRPKPFDKTLRIAAGHTIRFLVFSGPIGKDGTYDATALIAHVEWY